MSPRRYAIARVGWAAVATYIVVSVMFLLVAIVPDHNDAFVLWTAALEGATPEELTALERALQPDESLNARYRSWLVAIATFDWGMSSVLDVPVTKVVAERGPVTLMYVIPGALLSFLGAILMGYLSAARRTRPTDYVITGASFVVLSVPNFLVASLIVGWIHLSDSSVFPNRYRLAAGVTDPGNLLFLLLPTFVLSTHLFAIYVRYTRAESLEYLEAAFVKLLKAKGAGRGRVAWHTLRNAAVPLVTLFVVEVLEALLVTVFVIEAVFQLPGLGQAAYLAVENQDMGLTLMLVLLVAMVVVVANLLQDLAYTALDPRLRTGD